MPGEVNVCSSVYTCGIFRCKVQEVGRQETSELSFMVFIVDHMLKRPCTGGAAEIKLKLPLFTIRLTSMVECF